MTIEEKLEKFYQVSIESARETGEAELTAYQEGLEKIFQEHKETAERQNEQQLKIEREESRRLSNMEVSKEQLQMKHKLRKMEAEMTERLFDEVEEKLTSFRESDKYKAWLIEQIKEDMRFDEDAPIRIYIDPQDESMLPELQALITRENVEICVSAESFIGGSRGVIHSRNILIDNSIKRRLADIRDNYQLREEL